MRNQVSCLESCPEFRGEILLSLVISSLEESEHLKYIELTLIYVRLVFLSIISMIVCIHVATCCIKLKKKKVLFYRSQSPPSYSPVDFSPPPSPPDFTYIVTTLLVLFSRYLEINMKVKQKTLRFGQYSGLLQVNKKV